MSNNFKAKEPMFNFGEKVPAYLAGVFIAIHIAVNFLPRAIDALLAPFLILRPLGVQGADFVSHAMSLVGHGFLHGSWSHVLMNSGMTIVFGIATIRGIKFKKASPSKANLSFMLIFLAGVIVGGIFQWGWWSASASINAAAVGASGGASALFATTGWAIGGRDKMLQFGLGWAVINIIMVVAEPVFGVSLAWAAHMGGYIGGMILAPILVKASSTRLGVH